MSRILLVFILALPVFAAGAPTVRITSPSDGFLAAPGDRIGVDLQTQGEPIFHFLALLGPLPIVGQDLVGAPPYHFVLEIPLKTDPGVQKLKVLARLKGLEHLVTSNSVEVDIELPDSPEHIRVSPTNLNLWIGGQQDLVVIGAFKDGRDIDISKSTRLTFKSEDPNIAAVSRNGKVVGVSAGSTKILVNGEIAVSVVVIGIGKRKQLVFDQ